MTISDIFDFAASLPRSSTLLVYPSAWFEFSLEHDGNTFKVPVCQFDGDFLLNYDFSFQTPFSTKMALQIFTQTLDIELDNAFISDTGSKLFESDFPNFLRSILNNKIFIVVKLSKKKVKRIKERINIIKEIVDSEISYNMRLLKLKDIVKFFEDNSILDNETQALLSSLIESLYTMSNAIKTKLSTYTSYYMVPLGQILLKFASLIPVYLRYSEILKEAMEKFRTNMKSPHFQTIVHHYQSEPYFENLSIEQYMHEPEQRLPRYRLFVQRVLGETPWGHPDKVLLMSVLEKFDNERIKNNEVCLFDDQATLEKYPSELKEYIEFMPLEEGQGYLCNYKVLFENNESIAIIYSNYLRIFIISSQSANVFNYQILRVLTYNDESKEYFEQDASNECVIFAYGFYYRLKFKSNIEMKSFVSNVKEATFMYQLRKAKFSVGLNWDASFAKCPVRLQHHSMAELNGNIYVFGGIDEKGLFSSSLVYYNIESGQWHHFESKEFIQMRKDAAMITMNDKIYLFGGYSENYEPLNDLWSFDGSDWSVVEKNVKMADGGYYSALKFSDEQILFVGGEIQIQTLIYNINEKIWTEICQNDQIPPMRYHNIACCSETGTVLMFGGMSISENEPVKNLFVLDEENNSWKKNPISLIGKFPKPRYGNLMLSLKSYIFILGGIGSNTPFILNSENRFVLIRNEGNFPLFMSFAAACVVNDNEIWALGGNTEDGTSNTFYKISVLRENVQEE